MPDQLCSSPFRPLPLPGGRTVSAGTRFIGGGSTWTVLEGFTYPEGSFGNESHPTEIGVIGNYLLPVYCDSAGKRFNTAPGTITVVSQVTPGLVSVTNPAAAYGGSDVESYEETRARYFRARIEEDLLVTHSDFEAAAQKIPGRRKPGLCGHTAPYSGIRPHLSALPGWNASCRS